MNHPSEFAHLFSLPIAERLQLVEALWDSIAADNGQFEISEETRVELRERQARHEADPGSALTWDEVKQRKREP